MYCFIQLKGKLFFDSRTTCKFDTGIFRYMREGGVSDINFSDAKDALFQDLRKTLDAGMNELASRRFCQSSRSLNSRTRGSDG